MKMAANIVRIAVILNVDDNIKDSNFAVFFRNSRDVTPVASQKNKYLKLTNKYSYEKD